MSSQTPLPTSSLTGPEPQFATDPAGLILSCRRGSRRFEMVLLDSRSSLARRLPSANNHAFRQTTLQRMAASLNLASARDSPAKSHSAIARQITVPPFHHRRTILRLPRMRNRPRRGITLPWRSPPADRTASDLRSAPCFLQTASPRQP